MANHECLARYGKAVAYLTELDTQQRYVYLLFIEFMLVDTAKDYTR